MLHDITLKLLNEDEKIDYDRCMGCLSEETKYLIMLFSKDFCLCERFLFM
jgi:hypothetical protein